MAYNPGHVSIKSVIERAYRKSGLEKIEWEESLEWAADLMALIGVPSQYIDMFTNGMDNNPAPIQIIDGRGELPYGVNTIRSCRRILFDRDGRITRAHPMIESTGTFYQTDDSDSLINMNIYPSTIYATDISLSEDDDLVTTNIEVVNIQSESMDGFPESITPNEYKINGGIIFTDFTTGYVEMAYTSIPLDSQGLPMIPDDYKYIRAIEDYIIERIDYRVWRRSPSPQNKSILNDSEQKSAFSIGSARTKGRIPSVDQMESIKNMWLRSIPRISEHSNNFNSLNKQEVRYNNRG
jgi:hypothetical protein